MISKIEITVDGLNLEDLLRALIKQKVTLYAVRRIDRFTAVITVAYSNRGKVLDLLREKCYNVHNVKFIGAAATAERLKRHIALFVVLVLLVPLLIASGTVCWRIEVRGADRQQVLDALYEYGVGIGRSLVSLSYDKLENYLTNAMNASFVTAVRKGSTLLIEVVERSEADEPIDLDSPADIVAQSDGVVSRIVLIQGTALVQKGDTVSKGQILIKGERIYNDGTVQPVRAVGQVFATVVCSQEIAFNGYLSKYVRTGESFAVTEVVIGSYDSHGEVPFETYETVSTSLTVYPFAVTLVHTVYYRTVLEVQKVSLSQCLDDLKRQALDGAVDKCTFAPYTVTYNVSDNKVTAVLTGEIEIGEVILR